MIIYYTHSYKNRKGESGALLERAVARYLGSGRSEQGYDGDCEKAAQRLVSSRRTTGEFGKPYIPGFVPFSISHSCNTWAVLLAGPETSQDRQCDAASLPADGALSCGLDVQYPRKVDAEAVLNRFFSPDDAGCSGDFFRLWARREALVKAAGTSVAGTDIPSVREDSIRYEGMNYRLYDIDIPGCEASAAICLSACIASDMMDGLLMQEL